MLICHCEAVNEATIRAAIQAGAGQLDDLVRRCGAGARCGGCLPALLDLLEHAEPGPGSGPGHAGVRTPAA